MDGDDDETKSIDENTSLPTENTIKGENFLNIFSNTVKNPDLKK